MANTIDCIKAARAALEAQKDRSAWGKGVNVYALELLDGLEEDAAGGYLPADAAELLKPRAMRAAMLNGADDWHRYSKGGSALIYDGDIAARLCCPSEYRRTRGGERNPNSRETWLDVQARALFQAANRVFRVYRDVVEG